MRPGGVKPPALLGAVGGGCGPLGGAVAPAARGAGTGMGGTGLGDAFTGVHGVPGIRESLEREEGICG